ncbi:hypothetical protein Tco_0481454 [Tanacetum coccineum]
MDTKILTAPESINTLARCWFRRNVPMTTFGSWHDKLRILVVVVDVEGWANEFHQDKASSVRVPVANFTLQSSEFFLSGVPIGIISICHGSSLCFQSAKNTHQQLFPDWQPVTLASAADVVFLLGAFY